MEKQNKTSEDLKILVTYGEKNKLFNVFKKKKKPTKLFLKMKDHWSFFNYDFLGLIIKGFCTELQPDFEKYILEFKKYCQRRLCEVPADIFETRPNEKNNLYVKCDHYFDKLTLKEAKDLECRLSDLLATELYLLRIEEGCVQLVFGSLCDLTTKFPLNGQQKEQLSEMGILQLYHEDQLHYDKEVSELQPVFTDHEISMIVEEVQRANKGHELAQALEMSGHMEGSGKDVKTLLLCWQEKMTSANTSARPVLMYHLAEIGLQDLHSRLVTYIRM